MRFFAAGTVLAALAAPLVQAIAITDPPLNSTLTKGQSFDLTWTSVDTDPSTFSILLVNFVNWPPFYTFLAQDVETSLGTKTVRVPCAVDAGYGFQFNAINGTNTYIIYAQSSDFFIGGADCTDPTTTSSVCAPTATVTVTVSKTLSSSSSSYSGVGNSSSTTPITTTSCTTHPGGVATVHTTVTTTSYGQCPDVIGWGSSGYDHPVSLTSPPHHPHDTGYATSTPTATSEAYATTSIVYTTVYQPLDEASCGECY